MQRVTRWIGILSSVFVVGFLIYWAFSLGRRDTSEVPVIAAMEGDARTAPENQEEEAEYQDLEVNGVLEGETPEPSSDLNIAPEPDDLSDIEPAEPVDGAVDTDEEAAETETIEVAEDDLSAENTGDEPVVEDATQEIAAPARRPELLYIPPESDSSNEEAVSETETVAEAAEDSASEADEIDALVEEAQNDLPSIDEEPEPEAEPEPTPAAATVNPGTPLIQLAANLDEATTRQQWEQLKSENKDILGDKSLYVEKAVVNGTTYYRLRVSGFANSEDTRAACATLMARNVACLAVAAQ